MFYESITEMERWAEVAGDQMEESLVMEHAGLYSENDPSKWCGSTSYDMDGVMVAC